MNTDNIAALLTAGGFAAIVVALINWAATRRKTGADTAVVLSGEAREWANQAMERVAKAEARVDALTTRADEATERADAAEEKAESAQKEILALKAHVQILELIMTDAGLDPPPLTKI